MSSVQESAGPAPSTELESGHPSICGTVKWFDVKKGFGFIVGPAGEDVFVHFSVIEADGFRTLKDGEAVEYELHSGDKGLHAQHVRRSKEAPEPPKLKATVHSKARVKATERHGSKRAAAQGNAKPATRAPKASKAPKAVEALASVGNERASLGGTIAADAIAKRRPALDGYVG